MLPWPTHLQEAKILQETKRADKTLASDSTYQVFSGISTWVFGWSHQSMDKNYTMEKMLIDSSNQVSLFFSIGGTQTIL